MTHILRIDASARNEGSTTRPLADQLVNSLAEQGYGATVTRRDLNTPPPALRTESWIGPNSTHEYAHSADQQALLSAADKPIAELNTPVTIEIRRRACRAILGSNVYY